MPKKQGLGRDLDKALEIMETLQDCLVKFEHCKVKQGLRASKIDEDGSVAKMFDKATEEAFALGNQIQNIIHGIQGLKSPQSSRFATDRVIKNFLEDNI